jgi:hypothetical protein
MGSARLFFIGLTEIKIFTLHSKVLICIGDVVALEINSCILPAEQCGQVSRAMPSIQNGIFSGANGGSKASIILAEKISYFSKQHPNVRLLAGFRRILVDGDFYRGYHLRWRRPR